MKILKREPARPAPVVPLLPYQDEDFRSTDRFRWNCWSRQTGKSFTKSLRRIFRALERRRNQIFLSAGERQSRELMQKARLHCQALKIAADYLEVPYFRDMTIKQLEIVLPGKVRIIGLPANPDTARGYTGDVFLDEFAMHTSDRDIWAAVFPAMLRGDGELDVASTPKGCGNMFFQLRDNPMFAHSVITLPDAIRQGLKADPDEIRRAIFDDMLYRQEFLCEFIDDSTAFLTYEQIATCEDPLLVLYTSAAELADVRRDLYVGIDVGRVRDLTVIWVLADHVDYLATVAVFELAAATFTAQFELICELHALDNVRRTCIDSGGLGMQLAEQAVEKFGKHRVRPITFTPAVKSQIAGNLRIAVEQRRIRIPSDERIRNDWHSVERSVTRTGQLQLSAPRREGSHADRFWAAALAWHACETSAGPVEYRTIKELPYARMGTW